MVRVHIHCGSVAVPSGGVRVVLSWARAAAELGWRVTLLTPDGAPPRWPPPTPLEVAPIASDPGRPDLAIATVWWTAWACKRWASGGVPCLHLIQEDETLWSADLARRRVIRAAFGLIGRKVCVSRWVADRLTTARDAVEIVPPPLSLPVGRARPLGGEPPVLGLPFRSEPEKGWPVVEAVARGLRRDGVRFAPGIWGPGAHSHAPADLGPVEEPADDHALMTIYDSVDVLLHASWHEGFGLPPLEAMARGAAVVLTRSGGVGQFAEDGVNCLMAEPGDVAGLQDRVSRLIRSRPLREALGARGVESARAFGLSRFLASAKASLMKAMGTRALQADG